MYFLFLNLIYRDQQIGLLSIVLVIIFIVFSCWKSLSLHTTKKSPNTLMPGYKLIYADTAANTTQDIIASGSLLYSKKLNLQGKPDYIFRHILTGALVPIELKSGSIGNEPVPREGDLLQLCSYFLLVQEVFHRKPRYGKLVYKDAMFIVKNNAAARHAVKKKLKQMRRMLQTGSGKANSNYLSCRHCICRSTVCKFTRN